MEYLAGGDSVEDLLAEFPDLKREDILACHEFSRRILAAKSIYGSRMKFLVDAHRPRWLCALQAQHGHNATHTLDLPARNSRIVSTG